MSKDEYHPLSPKVLLSGVIITVLGGTIVAYLIGEGRFANNSSETQSIQNPTSPPATPVVQQVIIVVTATPEAQVVTEYAPLLPTATHIDIPSTDTSQPTATKRPQPTAYLSPTAMPQAACSSFTIGSTPTVVSVGIWVATRICSPAQNACSYTVEQSSGREYSSYEHNEPSDRRWVNAFCSEADAKNFANKDAKAMLQWWPSTNPNPFP